MTARGTPAHVTGAYGIRIGQRVKNKELLRDNHGRERMAGTSVDWAVTVTQDSC